ncbi:MAG: energy transducer TonB [Opitutaceae bacterium]|nr:energy transducer TonB [Opitutaceae bacterium]
MKTILLLFASTITLPFVGCTTSAPVPPTSLPLAKPSFVPPSPVYMTNPLLPPAVKAAGVRGVVLVEWLVGETGDVKEVKIIESPDPRLSALVTQAVLNWKFKPAMRDGKPVENRMRLDIRFD